VKVHICTRNRLIEATLTVSNKQESESQGITAFPSPLFLDDQQSPCTSLSIPKSLFSQDATATEQYPTKSAASSDSVHSFDGSLISVFNTHVLQPESSNYTDLEPSFELPIDDSSFIQELLNAENPTATFPDLDLDNPWLNDISFDPNTADPFEVLFNTDPMTFKELEPIPMQDDGHTETVTTAPASSSSLPPASAHDDTTMSSASSTSDDTERDDVNRRGMKKSGGPVRKLARFGNKQVIKYSNEYHDRRVKNNEAVKKSRQKAKEKQKDTETQMSKLADENRMLNDRVDLLMKELQVLKSLYKELNQDLPTDSVRALERVNVR
jgi:hypothetical protein